MQLTTQIIKTLNESFSIRNADVLQGWFVSLDGNTVYDISSDKGGGHHAGYTNWLQTNHASVGISKEDADWINEYFVGDGPNWDNPIENNNGELVGQWYPTLIKKIKPIYTNFFRIVYLYGNANITVLSGDLTTLRAVVNFVIQNESADKYSYWIDTYNDHSIIRNMNLKELMEFAQ